jgi:hypothetical protein
MAFINPINNKKHRTWNTLHLGVKKELSALRPIRDGYDAITGYGVLKGEYRWFEGISASKIIQLFKPALEQEYIDLDKKGRGSCLNHDLYAYDPDQGVAIIQARQYYKRAARHFGATRKTYFLVGKNEITGEYFRHPVGSHAIRAAIRKNPDPAYVVKAAQMWMWEVSEKQLSKSIRQGDILLVPEKPKNAAHMGHSLTVAQSHKILADDIRVNGRCYALNPRMIHIKNQHEPVELFDGWYSVRVAREADAWNFAMRIGD